MTRWMSALVLTLWVPAHAEIIRLEPDGSGDYPTIQAAIDAAENGDEIVLADGGYAGAGNRSIDFLGKAITLRSASGNPNDCIVDADPNPPVEGSEEICSDGLVFQRGEGPDTIVEGVTVRGAHSEYFLFVTCGANGSGVLARNSSPTLRNLRLVEDGGGGLFCVNSSATITGSVISANNVWTSFGGGVYLSDSNVVIEDCAIERNWNADTPVTREAVKSPLGTPPMPSKESRRRPTTRTAGRSVPAA